MSFAFFILILFMSQTIILIFKKKKKSYSKVMALYRGATGISKPANLSKKINKTGPNIFQSLKERERERV